MGGTISSTFVGAVVGVCVLSAIELGLALAGVRDYGQINAALNALTIVLGITAAAAGGAAIKNGTG